MLGQIIKIRSGVYTVESGEKSYECTARGALKIKSEGIVTGDFVNFDEKNLAISGVNKRDNYFIRPNIANIGLINVVIANPPFPDMNLVDKLILAARYKNVECMITVNKSDLLDDFTRDIEKVYGKFVTVVVASAKTKENIEILKNIFTDKLVCFAGQSAVGKTSLINALCGTDNKTGDISEKSGRGKHTTTASEIISGNGMRIIDTPGFSSLYAEIEPEELSGYFFKGETFYDCKFAGCSHFTEPDCEIKRLVNEGKIDKERYERYKAIYLELKELRRKKYV